MSETPSNLPAVRLETEVELVNPVTDSWTAVLPGVVELARSIAGTDFVPNSLRNNIAATAAAVLYGREIGLPPMTALNNTHVIKGKVGISAEIMRAQVLAAGHEIQVRETNAGRCTMAGKRRGSDHWTEVTYTIDDARLAGLLSNDNYKKNPRRMLQARASSELCALAFPDVIRGMSSAEELWDAESVDAETAPIDRGSAPSTTTKVQRRPRRGSAHPQTGDGATVSGSAGAPPVTGRPPIGAPSPLEPPLPGEPGYEPGEVSQPEPPGTASGGTVGVGDVSGVETADGSASVSPPGQGDLPAPTTQTPAPNPVDGGTADGASPIAGEQGGEGGAPRLGGSGAPPDSLADEDQPRLRTAGQAGELMGHFRRLGYDRDERLDAIRALIGRDIDSTKQVTFDEARTLIDALSLVPDKKALDALLAEAKP